ncbi:MAG TPA: arylsulfotransferase family protein, partial [Gemmataceae bacterium]
SPPPGNTGPNPDHNNDLLHTNSVKVLNQSLASKFPLFKPGQVLLSLRSLDTVAVLDRHTGRVVWASRGVWQCQHDAEFLDNGHLLVYDNLSLPKQTRIVEYDPQTQATPWAYSNEDSTPFSALFRGMKQRLTNGNTFIVDPDNRRLFEVTQDKELVWESFCPLPFVAPGQRSKNHPVNCARRYDADKLTFLKGVARARP